MNEIKNGAAKQESNGNTIKYLVLAGVILAAFLVGLIPATMSKWTAQEKVAESQKELRNSQTKSQLLTAIVESKRGEYENARQAASDFFTRLTEEQKSERETSYLSQAEIDRLGPVFSERDAIITMLAQRDPASVERLTDVYLKFEKALEKAPKDNASQK